MNEEEIEFWEQVDRQIYDIIQLIRLKYTRFNNTPIEKVVNHLYNGFKAAYDVQDALEKGWHVA